MWATPTILGRAGAAVCPRASRGALRRRREATNPEVFMASIV